MNGLISYHKIKAIFSNNERYQRLLLILVLILCLVPFVDKAFHIDDPLFIWSAQKVISNPGDFYGFTVNWAGFYQPMNEAMMNPPLNAYFIAGIIYVFGPNEVTLHLAFLIIAIICAMGIFEIAKEFGVETFLSSLIAVLCPFFLLSASNIMSDVLMLTFWIWSLVFWMKGSRENRNLLLFISAVLVSLCILTKYLGAMVFALIVIYELSKKRRFDVQFLYLLIPITIIFLYELYNIHLYGKSHLNLAASFSIQEKSLLPGKFFPLLVAFVYLGGGFVGCLPVILYKLKSKQLIYGLLATALISAAFLILLDDRQHKLIFFSEGMWIRQAQISVMIAAGLSIFFIAIKRLIDFRDAESILLLAWIIGPFLFAAVVNWTVNARTLLPALPAISIVFTSFIRNSNCNFKDRLLICIALILTVALSVNLLIADFRSANSARDAAKFISRHLTSKGEMTFQGHWGFQYYMQNRRYMPVDFLNFSFKRDDIMIIPSNQSRVPITKSATEFFQAMDVIISYSLPYIGVQNSYASAGFYSSKYGPAPYLFIPFQPEKYTLYRAKKDFKIDVADLLRDKWINKQ